ncbi:MAG TPA: hypothetical protein VG267_17545 [Terracidiphilus sp.]|jgi:hypothetical protein|nr:hypothetical protein [Terracidiphilus sp.]
MKLPWANLEGPARMLSICAAVFLVSGGLCGIQWAVASGSSSFGQALVGLFMVTGLAELVAMAISLVGMAVAIILWIAGAIYDRASGPSDRTQKLFDTSDEPKLPPEP